MTVATTTFTNQNDVPPYMCVLRCMTVSPNTSYIYNTITHTCGCTELTSIYTRRNGADLFTAQTEVSILIYGNV